MRFMEALIFTRFARAGHMRTMSAATSNTIEACCLSAAQP